MNRLTWLHISDLHFRTSEEYNANIVFQALLRDIAERIQDDDLRPDFIAFTGDVAFSGKPDEYDLARNFFNDLLKTTDLSSEQLFIIPGNHDVDRSQITPVIQRIGDSLTDRNITNTFLNTPDERQLVFKRFNEYAAFVSNYFADHLQFDDEDYFYVRTLNIAGQQIAVLGCNYTGGFGMKV